MVTSACALSASCTEHHGHTEGGPGGLQRADAATESDDRTDDAGTGTTAPSPSTGGGSSNNSHDGGTVPNPGNGDFQIDPTSRECSTERVVDKADLLFVVDNSGSMIEEQAALRAQFPRLVQVLTTGDTDGDGQQDFPPATDLHLGVVSSDMGLIGISSIDKCDGQGDDGILQNAPSSAVSGCQAMYPSFLSYSAGVEEPDQTATDFACIASLGTEGCGFEQQLEAGLKALWPSVDVDPVTGAVHEPNRILFLADQNGFGTLGHGDVENAGFLRNDPSEGLSLIAVIVVTDEEDCSSRDTSHFTPSMFLPPEDPRAQQGLNMRCFFNPQNLYPIERYVRGFRALRSTNEALVMFAAIAGVPPDLVSETSRANVDFNDESQRNAYYDTLLADVRMQEVPDPQTSGPTQTLLPSCMTGAGKAYPPRRIVNVARGFGANGMVQSICEGDFEPAVDGILARIAERLRNPCPAPE
jgi:hypothetical protein